MQSKPNSVKKEYAEIAEGVRTGEYFRKARSMYDFSMHDPMAERYLYIFITFLSSLAFVIAIAAVISLYPLSTPVPFIFSSTNVVNDLPHMQSLARKGENPSAALLRFFVENYVTMREEYNIDTFDRNQSGVESQSSPEVFKEFEQAVNPRNPESPIALYQRHSWRRITIVSLRLVQPGTMEVIYESDVEGVGEAKKSRWQANIAFQYSGLAIDEKTGKAKPVSFVVTQYHTKRLQDIK